MDREMLISELQDILSRLEADKNYSVEDAGQDLENLVDEIKAQ